MSGIRVQITIAPRALVRAQDGLDLLATGAAFLEALEPVLRRDIPELCEMELTLRSDPELASHRVEVAGPDPVAITRLDREVRDLIWVVREMVPFAVLSST